MGQPLIPVARILQFFSIPALAPCSPFPVSWAVRPVAEPRYSVERSVPMCVVAVCVVCLPVDCCGQSSQRADQARPVGLRVWRVPWSPVRSVDANHRPPPCWGCGPPACQTRSLLRVHPALSPRAMAGLVPESAVARAKARAMKFRRVPWAAVSKAHRQQQRSVLAPQHPRDASRVLPVVRH